MTATPRHDALRKRILGVPMCMRTDILLDEYAKLEREILTKTEGVIVDKTEQATPLTNAELIASVTSRHHPDCLILQTGICDCDFNKKCEDLASRFCALEREATNLRDQLEKAELRADDAESRAGDYLREHGIIQ